MKVDSGGIAQANVSTYKGMALLFGAFGAIALIASWWKPKPNLEVGLFLIAFAVICWSMARRYASTIDTGRKNS